MKSQTRLTLSLFSLRLTVALVMLVWNLDKFINPGHAATIYEDFYRLGGLAPAVMYAIGAVEIVIVGAFLLGVMKRFSYGAVLVLHAISTFSSYKQYLAPMTTRIFSFSRPGPCWRPALPSICCGTGMSC